MLTKTESSAAFSFLRELRSPVYKCGKGDIKCFCAEIFFMKQFLVYLYSYDFDYN